MGHAATCSTCGLLRRSLWPSPRADGTTDGTRGGSPLLDPLAERVCLVMAHETPGDSLARGLPSPVCTARAGRQGPTRETMMDCGGCPAQRRYARWFTITNIHRLLAAFPNPHKGRLLPVCCLRWVARCVGPTDLWSQQWHDDVVDHRHDDVVGHRAPSERNRCITRAGPRAWCLGPSAGECCDRAEWCASRD
jgi:hypothetical protein